MNTLTEGIFSYRSWLPAVDNPITLGEGNTSLVDLPRLGRSLGLGRLLVKIEGSNPTGSYKDRVSAMSMSLALQRGNIGWVATSSGNAGASLAAYGARAALPGYLFVVPNIPREKLIPALALGARVFKVSGVGDNARGEAESSYFEAVEQVALANNLFLGITAHRFNPEGMRGAETIGYELGRTEARAVYVPTGGGGLATAIGRGLRQLESPMAVVVAQPSGCAPIVRCLEREIDTPVIDHCLSKISALQLPAPPDGDSAVQVVRESDGWGTACSDQEILSAQRKLAVSEGLFVEPASAAALAAVEKDRKSGRLTASDTVVAVMTASGLKDLVAVEHGLEPPTVTDVDQIDEVVERDLAESFSSRAIDGVAD